MNSDKVRWLLLVSLGFLFSLLLPGQLCAHTAIAVNGSVLLTIGESNTVVEYQLECGALTAIDVRPKIDGNADGTISKEELKAFNEAAQHRLTKAESWCYFLLDGKSVTLLAEKVEFTLPGGKSDGTVLLKLRLASKKSLSPGSHQLSLDRDFCPLDVELLSLPIAAPRGRRHGKLLRILKVTVVGEPSVEFSNLSGGYVAGQGEKKRVRCLLNNLVKLVHINFELVKRETDETQNSASSTPLVKNVPSVDAITRVTPIALNSPVRITEISTLDALTFDPNEKNRGTISYKLSKGAWVRIRILLRSDEQFVLRTLVDWSEREAGKHVETWDGRDAAGHFINKARFPCFVAIDADSEIHRKHQRSLCKELRLTLKLKDSAGGPVRGKVDVEVTLDEDTRGYGQRLGYTVRAYVDFKLLHSSTYKGQALHGFDFPLDTTDLSAGEHLLTVVVDDGADHVGSTSLKFKVLN